MIYRCSLSSGFGGLRFGLTLQGKGLADSFAVCMKLSLVAIASQVSVRRATTEHHS